MSKEYANGREADFEREPVYCGEKLCVNDALPKWTIPCSECERSPKKEEVKQE